MAQQKTINLLKENKQLQITEIENAQSFVPENHKAYKIDLENQVRDIALVIDQKGKISFYHLANENDTPEAVSKKESQMLCQKLQLPKNLLANKFKLISIARLNKFFLTANRQEKTIEPSEVDQMSRFQQEEGYNKSAARKK